MHDDPDQTDALPGLPPEDLATGSGSVRASWEAEREAARREAQYQAEVRALREAVESRERLIATLRDALAARDAEAAGRARVRADAPDGAAAAGGAPPAASGLQPALVRLDRGGETVCVLRRRTRIGRAEASELHIDSASVSRHHALVLTGPNGVIIEDLNSTNGVYVNGRKVARQRLRDGDAVTIGEAEFRFTGDP